MNPTPHPLETISQLILWVDQHREDDYAMFECVHAQPYEQGVISMSFTIRREGLNHRRVARVLPSLDSYTFDLLINDIHLLLLDEYGVAPTLPKPFSHQ